MKHIADKRTAEWIRRYPSAPAQADEFYKSRREAGELWPEWCGLPMAAVYAIITQGADMITAMGIMRERPNDLPKLTAALLWRRGKAVYRPDKALVDELYVGDDMSMEVPSEILKQLPYRCIYIEYPFRLSLDKTALGCFVWLEADRRAPSIVELRLLFLMSNDNIINIPLKLEGKTLGDGLSLLTVDGIGFVISGQMLAAVRQAVSIALYICSEAADVETRAEAPTESHIPRSFMANPNAPTVWDVGVRIGAAIRAHRNAPDATPTPTGSSHASPRAHVRRAHWHSFWTGPRDGERKLKLRWLSPIFVNYTEDEEMPSVIREIRKGD